MADLLKDSDPASKPGEAVSALVHLMDRLREECPWDQKQTFADLSGYLLEECYEAVDALAREDLPELESELGDLLFQIVFLARLGQERRAFDLESVARRIHTKMVARHPHVFGEAEMPDVDAVRMQWEALKAKERSARGIAASPFDGLPRALPALLKAARMTSRAADLGFDWARDTDVLAKLREEVGEFEAEVIAAGGASGPAAAARMAGEIGDVLFTIVNVARRHGIDPEAALQATNAKFQRRFEEIGRRLKARGAEFAGTPIDELDRLWNEIKRSE